MTYVLMGIFLLAYAVIIFKGSEYFPEKEEFFDLHDAITLKGIFCIIVLLVHIPEEYQNPLQDIMGSFAYVGVTFFFMTSAYGLKYGMEHKEDYLEKFWMKRLPPILVPAIICNLISTLFLRITGNVTTVFSFININAWVKILLLYYFIFWIIHYAARKTGKYGRWPDICICLIVIMISLIDKLTIGNTYVWPAESVGFSYGILLSVYYIDIKKWIDKKWFVKAVLLFVISILVGLAYLKFKHIFFWGDYCLKIILGFMLLMLLLQVSRKMKFGNKILDILGSVSYEIYLLHSGVFALVGHIAGRIDSGTFIWLSVFITFLTSVIVRRLSNKILLKEELM